MSLDFSFEGSPAGFFTGVVTFPTSTGFYSYVAYRGPAHLRLVEHCRRFGNARCTFVREGTEVSFSAQMHTSDPRLIFVADIAPPADPGGR